MINVRIGFIMAIFNIIFVVNENFAAEELVECASSSLHVYGPMGPSYYISGPTGASDLSVTPVYATGPTGIAGPAILLCSAASEQESKGLSVSFSKDKDQVILSLEKKADILNYKHCKISDFQTPLTRNYSEVVQALTEKASSLAKFPKPFSVILAENYLQDKGVPAICEVILKSKPLRDNLVNFDLRNNRFTAKSLSSLKEIVVACPKLETMDISINYVDFEEFDGVFGSLPEQQRKKAKFSVF